MTNGDQRSRIVRLSGEFADIIVYGQDGDPIDMKTGQKTTIELERDRIREGIEREASIGNGSEE